MLSPADILWNAQILQETLKWIEVAYSKGAKEDFMVDGKTLSQHRLDVLKDLSELPTIDGQC
jgi:hypothetical protein